MDTTSEKTDELLTVGEAARRTGFSLPTIRKALDHGTLTGFKIPGSKHRRVSLASLTAWCSANGIPLKS